MKLLDGLAGDPAGVPFLLINDLARADRPLQADLSQVLADLRATIFGIGTAQAEVRPIVVTTCDRTPAIDEAVKRRCLHRWVDHLNTERARAQQRSRAR